MTTIRVTRTVEAPPVEAVDRYLLRRQWRRQTCPPEIGDRRTIEWLNWGRCIKWEPGAGIAQILEAIGSGESRDSSDVYDDMMEEWMAEREKTERYMQACLNEAARRMAIEVEDREPVDPQPTRRPTINAARGGK